MTKISKRSAAARKAWRTRKRMRAARAMTFELIQDISEPAEVKEIRRRLLATVAKNRLPNPFLEIGK